MSTSSMNEILKFMREEYDAQELLDTLPGHDRLRWIPWSVNPTVDLPEALIIGTVERRDVLAYVTQKGEKPREVRYCSIPAGRPSTSASLQTLTQDEVVTMKLDAPFKYNADSAKGMKRKFSVIIKWYFMARGLLENAVSGDLADWCKIFANALRNVEPDPRAIKGKKNAAGKPVAPRRSAALGSEPSTPAMKPHESGLANPRRPASGVAIVEESPDAEEPNSPYGLRSARRGEKGNTTEGAADSPHEQIPHTLGAENPAFETVRRCLEDQNIDYLLRNLPAVSEHQFFDARGSVPKKLYIGRTADRRDNIYAHLRVDSGLHFVEFWSRESKSHKDVKRMWQEIAKQSLIHPFNKTYEKNSKTTTIDAKIRLDTIIKWYFLAEGAGKDFVLKESPTFAVYLKQALAYIAQRMGPAAVPGPSEDSLTSSNQATNKFPKQTPPARPLDESQIQTSLASAVPSSATQASPRGTKRTFEDATFEALSDLSSKERKLTTDINIVDEELETHEMKKNNFAEQQERDKQQWLAKWELEKQRWLAEWELKSQNWVDEWEMEHDSILGRRETIAEERHGVRHKFRRLTLEVGQEE
ncbi:hypothetical protein HBI44_056490 [Parastagonospora nodorum]|nr:hypothetical protein HBI44_056490 [Parastagonospora nodorum]